MAMLEFTPNTPEVKQRLEELLTELAKKQGMPVICLYQNQGEDEVLGSRCLAQIRELAPQLAPYGKVTLLLDSPGGDIEDAYRIVSSIRRYVGEMTVLVPNWCKSAATFVALTADHLYLGPNGELGPLDPQLHDKRGSTRTLSALETFKALEYLRTYSMETLDAIVKLLMLRAEMDIPYALEHARSLVAAIINPLYQQVDPHELGEARRYLAVSEDYAVRGMRQWGYHNDSEARIRHIVTHLVWDYPTHGFIIDIEEARRIGLNNVEELDKETDRICMAIIDLLEGCTGIWLPEEAPSVSTIVEETEIPMEGSGDGTEAAQKGISKRRSS